MKLKALSAKHRLSILICLLLAMTLLSCGKERKQTDPLAPEQYLAEEFADIGAVRVTEPRVFRGDSLGQYLTDGAELYHKYRFVDVATADYELEFVVVAIDIYRLADNISAYGLFSVLRPPGAFRFDYGIGAFGSSSVIVFVKGNYLVRLTGHHQSKKDSSELYHTRLLPVEKEVHSIAAALEDTVPGDTVRPRTFDLFPPGWIYGTDRFLVGPYLGQSNLREVFTQDYIVNEDTIRLFLTDHQPGPTLLAWAKRASSIGQVVPMSAAIPFDQGKGFHFVDPQWGSIVAGIFQGQLIGMVGYDSSKDQILIDWMNSLRHPAASSD